MDDALFTAATRLGIPTHASAGPGRGPTGQPIWASWPRSRIDIAHDALQEVIQLDRTAGVAPAGRANRWRAYSAGWSYEGDFVEAVASLALYVSSPERSAAGARIRASQRRSPGSH